jgi:hypothetical protein
LAEEENKSEADDSILPTNDDDVDEPGIQRFDSWEDVWDKLEIAGQMHHRDFRTGQERHWCYESTF